MMMAGPASSNQLQFNLGVPLRSSNMAARFRSPQPIMVEKLGVGSHTPLELSYSHVNSLIQQTQQQKPAFEFSTISEDRLSAAVRLARRDLHKQRQAELLETEQDRAPPRRGGSKKKIPASPARPKINKRPEKVVGKKKQPEKKKVRPTTPVQAVIHVSSDQVAPYSPPTRDTDPYAPVRERSQEGRMMEEIQRLRNDMNTCMVQIHQIEQAAKAGSLLSPKPLPGTEDLPPSEQQRRRAVKSEENATRLARTLYALQRQVQSLQDDLKRCKKHQLTGERKSKYLSKLAAGYRAAVRALQVFVNQLSETDLAGGLPRAYRELVLIVRQLSLCSAQLEVAGENELPESVTRLLQDMANMNEVLEEELRGGDKTSKTKAVSDKPQRQLYPSHPPPVEVHKTQSARQPPGKENRVFSLSPDRQSALKRGIETLLRSSETPRSPIHPAPRPQRSPPPPDVPRLAITPRTPRAGPYNAGVPGPRVAWDLPPYRHENGELLPTGPYRHENGEPRVKSAPVGRGGHVPRPRQRKGLLLPSALQQKRAISKKAKAKRDRVARPFITGPSHYAEPTASTIMKKIHPHQLPQPEYHPPQPRHPSPPTSPPRILHRVFPDDAPSTFAEPTLASSLKVTQHRPNADDDLPPFLPTSRSPRRESPSPHREGRSPGYGTDRYGGSSPPRGYRSDRYTSPSPRREYLPSIQTPRTPRHSARSILASPRSPYDAARRDIAKQVMMDRKSLMKMKAIEDLKNAEKARFTRLKGNLNETDEWVRETERRIRDKIQPLLEHAQEINRRYASIQGSERPSDDESPDERDDTSDKVECNADVLSDMLLHDILEETVYDIQTLEDGELGEDVAWHMQQAPSIANLVRRLQEMEVEQDKIREKWATIEYEDEHHNHRAAYLDAAGSERPSTPPPIQLTKVELNAPRELTPTRTRMMRVPHPHDDDEEPEALYFTQQSKPQTHESLHLSSRPLPYPTTTTSTPPPPTTTYRPPRPIPLTIPHNMMENIRDYASRYDAHLKRTSNNPIGNFDPWHVVDEVAAAILSDCFEDVARELEEINSDVINHIYHSEFQKVPDEEETPR